VNVPNHKPKWVSPVRIIADARGNCYWIERGAYATREHLDSLRLAPGKVAPDADTTQEPDETGDEEEAQEPITVGQFLPDQPPPKQPKSRRHRRQ
jgi:hypothetical protein